MIKLGIDTGGTFTDLIALDDQTGRISTVKVPSTPSDPANAPLTAIKRSEIGPEITFTRLQHVPAGLESVISAATGLEIEDAGFTILSEAESDV